MSALDIVILILLLSWVGGFSMNVAGSLIHLLLVIALVSVIFRVINGGGGGKRIT